MRGEILRQIFSPGRSESMKRAIGLAMAGVLCASLNVAPAQQQQEKRYDGLTPEEAAKAMTVADGFSVQLVAGEPDVSQDRKSTRLNSSHSQISYAVFCLKKKKK